MKNNSDDDTGSITASESDTEVENKMNKGKKIEESDSGEDEENSPSILTLTGNNNDLVKDDDLNSSDIVLPTQQKSKKVDNVDNNDEDDNSNDIFQNDLQVFSFFSSFLALKTYQYSLIKLLVINFEATRVN